MNYVRVMGGLGNQMFQYTFSEYVEQKTSAPCVLDVNFFDYVRYVRGASVREFELDKMDTKYMAVVGDAACSQVVDEDAIDSCNLGDKFFYFNGYWQNKKYFEAVRDVVCHDFELKRSYVDEAMRRTIDKMENSNSVSVHIRRSDYLTGQNVDIFSELGEGYYSSAISAIANNGEFSIFIFSDDTAYAEELAKRLGISDYMVMPIREAYRDLYLMSCCRHHIIANSSFSWWGAVLGQHRYPDGKVVAPASWYKERPRPNLYFDDWIVV